MNWKPPAWRWPELPQRVTEYVRAQNKAVGGNFFLCQMMFGDMPLEFAQHSARLFAFEVALRLAA